MAKYSFTQEQADAYRALLTGRSVFLTGEAGTGKSYVLNAFLETCEHAGRKVLAMAPTGIAALNLRNGSTIHRTLGIKPTFCSPDEELGFPRDVLREAEVIVIDEISMVRIDLFERVVRMILAARRATGPKQVVLVGDFFQLPPVISRGEEEAILALWPGNVEGYCFKSNYWRGLALEPYVLHEVIRQSDAAYIAALNHARRGDASCAEFFNKHAVSKRENAPEDALWLCMRNDSADRINADRLKKLPGKPRTFYATVEGKINKGDMPTAEELTLKVGARVMAVKNDSDGAYQNGSLGTVVRIEDAEKQITVQFDDTGEVCVIEPHRWPVIKAVVGEVPDPESGGHKRGILYDEMGSFTQIPLRLAYAVTVHKSQGQAFSAINTETHAFAAGQLYVALSRCSTSAGLTIYPKIEPKYLHAQSDVVEFYDSLEVSGKYRLEGQDQDIEGDPFGLLEELLPWMRRNNATQAEAIRHFVRLGLNQDEAIAFSS